MKKISFSIVFLLSFSLFYWFGYHTQEWFVEVTENSSKTIQKSNTSSLNSPSSKNKIASAAPKDAEKNFKEFITRAQGAKLFEGLFQQEILLEYRKFFPVYSALQERFRSAYPSEDTPYQKEVVARMGLLKAMRKSFTIENSAENLESLVQLYKMLAANRQEHWLVRRQAMQNLSQWMKFLSEEERNKSFAVTKGRILATASFSESDFLEEIYKHD